MGLRLGLGAVLMMIAVIGGRIVPSFTRNWLTKQGAGRLPVPPMQRFDLAALGLLLAALLAWVAAPLAPLTGMALGLAGLVRLPTVALRAGYATLGATVGRALGIRLGFSTLGSRGGWGDIAGAG